MKTSEAEGGESMESTTGKIRFLNIKQRSQRLEATLEGKITIKFTLRITHEFRNTGATIDNL